MFINHIFPREKTFPDYYTWNNTFIKMRKIGEDSIEIEEITEKPSYQRAIHVLTQLNDFIQTSHKNYLNKCQITLICLNSSNPLIPRSFKSLDEASQVISRIVQRILIGYESAYLNLSIRQRVGIFKRIQDAIYLLFGWETERDKIHKLSIQIYQTIYLASEGFMPDTQKARLHNLNTLESWLKQADPNSAFSKELKQQIEFHKCNLNLP